MVTSLPTPMAAYQHVTTWQTHLNRPRALTKCTTECLHLYQATRTTIFYPVTNWFHQTYLPDFSFPFFELPLHWENKLFNLKDTFPSKHQFNYPCDLPNPYPQGSHHFQNANLIISSLPNLKFLNGYTAIWFDVKEQTPLTWPIYHIIYIIQTGTLWEWKRVINCHISKPDLPWKRG